MTAKRFFLVILFLGGVALGWFVRGENDGAVTEAAVKVEVEKAEQAVKVAVEHAVEIEKARAEKQIRDLEIATANLQDKLAVASAKDAIIARMQKDVDDLRSKLAVEARPPATPPEAAPTNPTAKPN